MFQFSLISKSILFLLFILINTAYLQENFTRADSLRGFLFPERSCYDVTYYALDIRLDMDAQSISGSNTITYIVVEDFDSLQVDLFSQYSIEKITDINRNELKFSREMNAVFVKFPERQKKGSSSQIKVYYSGIPKVSKRPPWDDGFTWSKDTSGNHWVGVTCQGTGASVWWPNKDHQSDEPDSMSIKISVPKDYMCVSNGRMRTREKDNDNYARYGWFVSYPINNYDVSFYVGKYSHISDEYIRNSDTLTLDYYVMPENVEKAKEQFKQVKPMLGCYEKLFGKYPFERDGYKLVEAPYPGMEHQSAVAYGNKYENGFYNRSYSKHGLLFDYIIIHESAHEWWGNSITTKDIADMWVHEGFATYSEALYLECMYDYKTSLEYMNAYKNGLSNLRPIIGIYGVNNSGSGEMYHKGSLVLNTLRSVINNDALWFEILKGIQETFKYKTINSTDIENYISQKAGTDYTYFFDQYMRHAALPKLILTIRHTAAGNILRYRWEAEVENFNMPVRVLKSPGKYEYIYPTKEQKELALDKINPEDFKADEDRFLLDVRIMNVYEGK